MIVRRIYFLAVLAVLLFLGALSAAKRQQPFVLKWLTLNPINGPPFKCAIVLPRRVHQCPVVIYAHGLGGHVASDGNDLVPMAEMGLATLSFEYNQTNETIFASEFEAVLSYVQGQGWAETNAIAWVGSSLGSIQMWNFALEHPAQQPQLLVQLSGAGLPNDKTNGSAKLPHCPVLLIHGDQDGIFPVEDTIRLAGILRGSGEPSILKIISHAPHNLQPDRKLIFRCIGEYCLTRLSGANAWQNYHSIARWEAEAPPFWIFCIPAVAWAISCFSWSRYHKPKPTEKLKLNHYEIGLRCLATVLAIWALSDTALHLLPPHFAVTNKTLSIARKYLVPAKERADFEFLANQPIWQGIRLKTLLTDAELTSYNRGLINWQLDETNYQNYVLSPVITGKPNEQFNWRRPLWEEFYPRIRHENSPEDAAVIVARHLRERVTMAAIPNPHHDVPDIWLRQITDETGFQIIYVAALRSVGIPSRLNPQYHTEFFNGTEWEIAPVPVIETFCEN